MSAEASDTARVLSWAVRNEALVPGNNDIAFALESAVDRVEITPAEPRLAAGSRLSLSAVGKIGAVTVLGNSTDFEWTSSAPSIALVDKSSGTLTGIKDGSAVVTAREMGNTNEGRSASVIVQVGNVPGAGRYTLLDLGAEMRPQAASTNGAVVGYQSVSGLGRPFVFTQAGGTKFLQLPPGFTHGYAWSVNASGEVCGNVTDQNRSVAARWTASGVPSLLPTEGDGLALAIGGSGTIVGTDSAVADSSRIVVWRDGQATAQRSPTGRVVELELNDSGRIVGSLTTTAGPWGFVTAIDSPVEPTLLKVAGSQTTWVSGLNGIGQVAGYAFTPSAHSRAILWSPALAPRDLGEGQAIGITNNGLVAGNADSGAFVWDESGGRRRLDLLVDTSDLRDPWITAVSPSGLILGTFEVGGKRHGMVLIPR